MSETRCPSCGAELPEGAERCAQCGAAAEPPVLSVGQGNPEVAFLRSEIDRWLRDGLLDRRRAERLLALYEPQSDQPEQPADPDDWPRMEVQLTPGMALLIVGGILVLSAVIMLLSKVWDDLGRGGQFLLALAPTVGLYAAGAAIYTRQPAKRVTGAVLLFFACVLVPFPLLLLVSWVEGSHDFEVLYLFAAAATFTVQVLTLLRFRSPLLTVPYPLTGIWLVVQALSCLHVHHSEAYEVALVLWGAVLLGIGAMHAERGKPAYAVLPDVVGLTLALGALFAIGADAHQPLIELVSLVASLAAIAASVMRGNDRYLAVGAPFLMINVFGFGFEYFEDTIGMPITLILCGAACIGLGWAIQKVRKEYTGGPWAPPTGLSRARGGP